MDDKKAQKTNQPSASQQTADNQPKPDDQQTKTDQDQIFPPTINTDMAPIEPKDGTKTTTSKKDVSVSQFVDNAGQLSDQSPSKPSEPTNKTADATGPQNLDLSKPKPTIASGSDNNQSTSSLVGLPSTADNKTNEKDESVVISSNPDDYLMTGENELKSTVNQSKPQTSVNDKPKPSESTSPADEKPNLDQPLDKPKDPPPLQDQPLSPFDVEEESEATGMWGQTVNKEPDQTEAKTTDQEPTQSQAKAEATVLNEAKKEKGVQSISVEADKKDQDMPLPPPPDKPTDGNQGSDKDNDQQPNLAVTNPPREKQNLIKVLIIVGLVAALGLTGFLIFNKFKKTDSSTPSLTNNDQQGQGPVKKDITLTYWGLWESEEIMKPIFDKFKQETGITVNYVQKSPRDYRLILENAIKEGNGPDIFRFHNTWVPMLKEELDNLPQQIYSREQFAQTFYPVFLQDLTVDGQIKGIPLEVDGLVLFYNKDLLTKAGLQENIATNWDQLSKQARQMTEHNPDGSIKISGVSLGTTNNIDHWSDIVGLMLYQNGVDMNRLDASVDTKGRNLAADVFRYYTHFVIGSSPVWDNVLPPSTIMFASGRLAYYFGPSWRAFEFAKNGVNFGIVNVPKIPGDSSEWATYWVEGVSVQSKHRQEAWRLLKFMSQPENLKLFFDQASKKRLFGEAYPRLDMRDELLKHPYLYAIVQAAPNFKSYYFASFTHDQGLNDRIADFLGQGINQVLQGRSPEQAIRNVDQEIKQILTNYNVQL